MSYSIIKTGERYEAATSHREFQIDAEADLAELPRCAAGSVAYLNDLSEIWQLSNGGVWTKI